MVFPYSPTTTGESTPLSLLVRMVSLVPISSRHCFRIRKDGETIYALSRKEQVTEYGGLVQHISLDLLKSPEEISSVLREKIKRVFVSSQLNTTVRVTDL